MCGLRQVQRMSQAHESATKHNPKTTLQALSPIKTHSPS
jgi:hypothetical protein